MQLESRRQKIPVNTKKSSSIRMGNGGLRKILLAKHYSFVIIATPRLITAASLKWMKWMAAAWWSGLRLLLVLAPPTCVDTSPGGTTKFPHLRSSPRSGRAKLARRRETSIQKFGISRRPERRFPTYQNSTKKSLLLVITIS